MKKFNTNTTFKKALLGGMSVVAFTAFVSTAHAATENIAGADAANATDITEATPTTLTAGSDDVFGAIDANGDVTFDGATGESVGTFDIDGNATLYIFDSDNAAANTLTIDTDADAGGSINVANDKTLNVFVGVDNASGNQNNVNLVVGGDVIGGNAGSVINFTTDSTSTSTLTFNGDVDLSTGSITLGNANDAIVIGTDGKTLTGNIVTVSGGGGTLSLTQGANVTGTVGASGAALTKINAGAGAGETNTFTGNVFASELAFNNGTVAANSIVDITAQTVELGTITTGTAGVLNSGTGDVVFKGATGASTVTLTGNVGTATNFIDLVQIDDNGQTSNTLKLTGTSQQVIYADDVAGNGGNEDISITNTAGVDFKGTVGAAAAIRNIEVGADGTSSSVIFNGAVTTTAINLGTAGGSTADTYSATFNTDGGYTVAGTVGGLDSADTVTVNIYDTDDGDGDDIVTFSGALSGIDTLNIGSATGKSGSAKFDATVAATTININAGNAAGNNAIADFNEDVTGSLVLTANATGGTASATVAKGITGGIQFNDDTELATVTFDGAIATGTTVSGAVTAVADGEGTIIVDRDPAQGTDAVTFSSTVGSSSAALATLTQTDGDVAFGGDVYIKTITGGAAHDLDFDGNVTAATDLSLNTGVATFAGNVTASTKFEFDADGTATFDGTSAQTVTGAITTTTGNGTINVDNAAGVTFANTLGANGALLKEVAVNASKIATFSDVVSTQTLDIDGTATFTVDNHEASTIEIADNSTITLGTGVASGETVFKSTTVTLGGTDGSVTVNLPSTFTSGSIRLIHDTDAGTTYDANDFAAQDTALVDYSVVVGAASNGLFDEDNQDLIVTATAKSVSTTASELGVNTQTASSFAAANTALASGDTAALTALNTVLATGGTTAKNAAEQITLQADTLTATSSAAIGTGTAVVGVASNRLASLRSGAQYASADATGFATGGQAMNSAAWVKPFGNWVSQDEKDGIEGYDADTYGLAAGVDTEVTDGVRLGVSFSYAQTDVDGDGAGQSETDIDSYQVTAYGDYTADTYYVEAMVGYARNDNEGSRKLSFGGLNRTAEADYDSDQYMVSIGAGMPINVGGNAFITPTAGLAYTHVSTDNYTETGAGNLNLNVNADDVDAFIGSLGASYHTKIKQAGGVLIPSARLGITYDFAGDEAQATGSYTGGGAAFTVEGADVEEFGGSAGLGLTFDSGEWSVGAAYDADFKSDYTGHSASIEARFKF